MSGAAPGAETARVDDTGTSLAAARAVAEAVADAVLYEGYVLYPYRASARKNQIRWQFGVLAPRSWAEAGGTEGWSLQAECLVEARRDTTVGATLRFMQVRHRQVERTAATSFEPVDSLEVDDRIFTSWDEGEPREAGAGGIDLSGLVDEERTIAVPLHASVATEPVVDKGGSSVGRVVRRTEPAAAVMRLRAERVDGPWSLVRLRVRAENLTPWSAGPGASREEAIRRSLVGAHLLLQVADGSFVSLLDPPEFARPAAEACKNQGVWPVLIGAEDRRDTVLASPVTLYDFPAVAPESAGELCDSTEIDEILALRVLTLTEEEKREARGTDARAAAIVDMADNMPPEMWERLHGTVRSLRDVGGSSGAGDPVEELLRGAAPGIEEPSLRVLGVPEDTDPSELPPWWDPGADASVHPESDTIAVGDDVVGRDTRVILRPAGQADAQDLFLAGREANVEAVFADVDGGTHLAVTLVDDPAADIARWHGRYLYFKPEEVEVLPHSDSPMPSAASPPRVGPQPHPPPERGDPNPTPGRGEIEVLPHSDSSMPSAASPPRVVE